MLGVFSVSPIELDFTRPQECPVVEVFLWSENQQGFTSVSALIDTRYQAIIGMPFLKNFNFAFKFGTSGSYHGKLFLDPLIKSSSLVELRNFNPTSSKFGVYSFYREDREKW